MNDNQKKTLAGRCGLYCGACDIYRAERDNSEIAERLATCFGVPAEKIKCEGCGALTPDSWGTGCKLVTCLDGKGYDWCYECPEYETSGCEHYNELAGRYLEEAGIDIRANMEKIKSGGVDEWLEESRLHYLCGHCGKPVIVGSEKCHHCDGKLN